MVDSSDPIRSGKAWPAKLDEYATGNKLSQPANLAKRVSGNASQPAKLTATSNALPKPKVNGGFLNPTAPPTPAKTESANNALAQPSLVSSEVRGARPVTHAYTEFVKALKSYTEAANLAKQYQINSQAGAKESDEAQRAAIEQENTAPALRNAANELVSSCINRVRDSLGGLVMRSSLNDCLNAFSDALKKRAEAEMAISKYKPASAAVLPNALLSFAEVKAGAAKAALLRFKNGETPANSFREAALENFEAWALVAIDDPSPENVSTIANGFQFAAKLLQQAQIAVQAQNTATRVVS